MEYGRGRSKMINELIQDSEIIRKQILFLIGGFLLVLILASCAALPARTIRNYYPDGTLRAEYQVIDRDGSPVRNGSFCLWYQNGRKSYEASYENGEREGDGICWYENGQVAYREHYKNGKLDGLHTSWYEDGNLEQKIMFDHEVRVWQKSWSPEGKLVTDIMFKKGQPYSGFLEDEAGLHVIYKNGTVVNKMTKADLLKVRNASP